MGLKVNRPSVEDYLIVLPLTIEGGETEPLAEGAAVVDEISSKVST